MRKQEQVISLLKPFSEKMVRPEFKTCKSVSEASAPNQCAILQKESKGRENSIITSHGLTPEIYFLYSQS